MQPTPVRHPEPFRQLAPFMPQDICDQFLCKVSLEPAHLHLGVLRSCKRTTQSRSQIHLVPVPRAAPAPGRQLTPMRGCGTGDPLQKQLRAPGLLIPIQHGSGAHLIALLGLLDLPVLGRVLPKSRFKCCGKQGSGEATLACKTDVLNCCRSEIVGLDGCSTSGCPNYKFCL